MNTRTAEVGQPLVNVEPENYGISDALVKVSRRPVFNGDATQPVTAFVSWSHDVAGLEISDSQWENDVVGFTTLPRTHSGIEKRGGYASGRYSA